MIKCSNETTKTCIGEIVFLISDICYIFYKSDKVTQILKMNEFCKEKNLTEIDYSLKFSTALYLFFDNIFMEYHDNLALHESFSYKYLSKIFALFFPL